MESIAIHQSLRPIRYAFLIPEEDKENLLKAVSINTVLWGGIFNPIIPLGDRFDVNGILEAFDADVLVNLSGSELHELVKKQNIPNIVSSNEILRQPEQRARRVLALGFGMGDILQYIQNAEFKKGLESSKVSVVTSVPDDWEAYAAASFGSFQHLPGAGNDPMPAYKALVGAKEFSFDPAVDVDYGEHLFPLEITAYGIRRSGRAANFSSHILFIGDPSNLDDLVEYWNIRATGRSTWFLPITSYKSNSLMVTRVIKSGQYSINAKIRNHVDLQKAPSISDDTFQTVVRWVIELKAGECVARDWRPRFGEETEYYVGDIHVADIEGVTSHDHSLLVDNRLSPIRLVHPPYLNDEDTRYDENKWAVELEISNPHSVDELVCELPRIAGAREMAAWLVHGGEIGTTRLGRNGVVLLVSDARSYAFPLPIKTTDVFKQILESNTGLEAKASKPGRYAEQIIKKMGSLQFDCIIFKLAAVREIIRQLSRGSTLTKGNIAQIIKREPEPGDQVVMTDKGGGLQISRIFSELLNKRILRPGLQFSCQNCSGTDWYHVSEFAEEYTCRYCFERQRVAFDSAGVREWAYKADGLFQIRDSAQGSIASIVALWRLHHTSNLRNGRYCTGMDLYDRTGNRVAEVDFCYVETDRFRSRSEFIIGEAKNFTDITSEQVTRLTDLADRFEKKPYLAFATLKDQFDDSEKQTLRILVEKGYKVIPMTRLELDPYDLYDRFDGTRYKYITGFQDLSAACVAVNLR